jgi:hypothetical protein
LGSGAIQRAKSEVDNKSVFYDLHITLAGLAIVLATGTMNQILVKRQVDSTREHTTRIPPRGRFVGLVKVAFAS